ncbi:MAG TPA: carboxypeptidase-like regulatory domain-containing protein, partial [Longimicrobium sp.]|nr:carboxypeptidase-like regulatory domain-containing protein [Longimicrobium sp.]
MSIPAGRRVRRGGWIPLLLALAVAPPAWAQQQGQVRGTAAESETGQPLAGAAVMVEGSNLRTVTDAAGRFVLAPVREGSHTIVLTYLGRQTQRQTVSVPADGVANVVFSVPVQAITLDGVTVLGMRARSQAAANNQQMNAPN